MLLFNFELLRNQRREKNLTQVQWGKIIGVTGSTVGNWERGETPPSVQALINIIAITGTDINDYFNERISEKNANISIDKKSPSNSSQGI